MPIDSQEVAPNPAVSPQRTDANAGQHCRLKRNTSRLQRRLSAVLEPASPSESGPGSVTLGCGRDVDAASGPGESRPGLHRNTVRTARGGAKPGVNKIRRLADLDQRMLPPRSGSLDGSFEQPKHHGLLNVTPVFRLIEYH